MKNIIFILFILLISIQNLYSQQIYQWQFTNLGTNEDIKSSKFINPNTGWIALSTYQNYNHQNPRILKTTNKGLNFTPQYSNSGIIFDIDVDFINENIGFFSKGDKIYKTTNGGSNWNENFTLPGNSYSNTIKFVNENTGYAAYCAWQSLNLYKTTNCGASWFLTVVNNWYNSSYNHETYIGDISFSNENVNNVWFCGSNWWYPDGQFHSILCSSNDGFQSNSNIYYYLNETRFSHINVLNNTNNSQIRILGTKGIYSLNISTPFLLYDLGTNYNTALQTGLSFSDQYKGFVATYDGKIWSTTNSGNSWSLEENTNIFYTYGSRMNSFNDIACIGTSGSNFYLRTLRINLTETDNNISGSTQFKFDNEYKSLDLHYLRGGWSSLYADPLLNSNTSSEKVFYKWSFGSTNYDKSNFYFDNTPGEIGDKFNFLTHYNDIYT